MFNSMTTDLPYLVGVSGDAFKINKADIHGYLMNPAFTISLDVWWFWSKQGTLPYSGGIYDQPEQVRLVIQLFEGCYTAFQSYKRDMSPGSV